MITSFALAIAITSIATFLSRILGVLSSEKISEESKIFRWFNCLAYSTLVALISRIVVFPTGALSETDYMARFITIITCILIFYLSRKNPVYPTVFSAILLYILKGYFI